MHNPLPKSFLQNFVLKSTLLFAGGALATAAIFYYAFQEQGRTYADSYKILADLNSVLVHKASIVFLFTLLLSAAAIILLAVVYSHRVAGALHKLGMHTGKIAAGELAEPVRLRSTDVVHVLADDMNSLSGHYRTVLLQMEAKTRELTKLIDEFEKHDPHGPGPERSGKISEGIEEMRQLLNHIKL